MEEAKKHRDFYRSSKMELSIKVIPKFAERFNSYRKALAHIFWFKYKKMKVLLEKFEDVISTVAKSLYRASKGYY